MKYWDSSALVPLLFEEETTGRIIPLVEEDPLIASWWGTPVECLSALVRRRREGSLKDSQFHEAREKLERLTGSIDFVVPSEGLRERTFRVLQFHFLNASDALQLASALRWSHEQTRSVAFVALDEKLREAARAEGFAVLP